METLNAILNKQPPPFGLQSGRLVALERVVARASRKRRTSGFDLPPMSLCSRSRHAARGNRPRRIQTRTRVVIAAAIGHCCWSSSRSGCQRAARRAHTCRAGGTGRAAHGAVPSSEAIEKTPAWSPTGDLLAYVSDAAGNDDIWIAIRQAATRSISARRSRAMMTGPRGRRTAGVSRSIRSVRAANLTMSALGANVRRLVSLKRGVLYTFSLTCARRLRRVHGFDATATARSIACPPPARAVCLTCETSRTRDAPRALAVGSALPSSRALSARARPCTLRTCRRAASANHQPGGRAALVGRRTDRVHLDRVDRPTCGKWPSTLGSASAPGPAAAASALGASTFALSPTAVRCSPSKRTPEVSVDVSAVAAARERPHSRDGVDLGDVSDRRSRWSRERLDLFFESSRRAALTSALSAGGEPRRVTTAAGSELRPRPSPQGSWVAFDAWTNEASSRNSCAPTDRCTRSTNAALDVSLVFCSDWSPDGKRASRSP